MPERQDRQNMGVPPSGSGCSAEPEPSYTVSAVPVSIPNAKRNYLAEDCDELDKRNPGGAM